MIIYKDNFFVNCWLKIIEDSMTVQMGKPRKVRNELIWEVTGYG